MKISHLDHFVLTIRSIPKTCQFYRQLGMEIVTFGNNLKALKFGRQKISLHLVNHKFEPKVDCFTPGFADFCLIITTP